MCVCCGIHKGYFIAEKVVLNVGIKAFWYTNTFMNPFPIKIVIKKAAQIFVGILMVITWSLTLVHSTVDR